MPHPPKSGGPAPSLPADPWSLRAEHFPARGVVTDKLRFLVRYAVLAPSMRNSQPWRFEVQASRVSLYVDHSRRQRHADPHERDLYISVGCALENLLVAAAHFGFGHEIVYFPLSEEDELVAQMSFTGEGTAAAKPSALFKALTQRRTNHGRYDGRPLDPGVLGKLNHGCTEEGLTLLITQNARIKRAVNSLVLAADAIALQDSYYRRELADAVGAGAFGGSGRTAQLAKLAVTHFGPVVTARNQRVLRSTPAFGLISAARAGRREQVIAGRVLERLYLTATTLGLSVQPLSALLEFEQVAAAFARLFRAGGVPLLPFRLGYGERSARAASRRPLDEVLHELWWPGMNG
jgi:nitroreductase